MDQAIIVKRVDDFCGLNAKIIGDLIFIRFD